MGIGRRAGVANHAPHFSSITPHPYSNPVYRLGNLRPSIYPHTHMQLEPPTAPAQVRFSQNIDFQFPMKKACENEIKLFCRDIPHGEARVIRCLQDNKYQKDFGKECKEEVGGCCALCFLVPSPWEQMKPQ